MSDRLVIYKRRAQRSKLVQRILITSAVIVAGASLVFLFRAYELLWTVYPDVVIDDQLLIFSMNLFGGVVLMEAGVYTTFLYLIERSRNIERLTLLEMLEGRAGLGDEQNQSRGPEGLNDAE